MSNTLHLYFCSTCDKFVTKIVATVAKQLTLEADSEAVSCNRFLSLGNLEDEYEGSSGIRVEDFVGEPLCPWCYNPVVKTTILKQNCPHVWDKVRHGTSKTCRLCGETKMGKVVFDE